MKINIDFTKPICLEELLDQKAAQLNIVKRGDKWAADTKIDKLTYITLSFDTPREAIDALVQSLQTDYRGLQLSHGDMWQIDEAVAHYNNRTV